MEIFKKTIIHFNFYNKILRKDLNKMKRMVSIALVCFLLCGCTKMNDDVSTYVDNSSIIESTSTNISDLSDITSNEDLTNSDTLVSENIITSSTVSSIQNNSNTVIDETSSNVDDSNQNENVDSEVTSSSDNTQQSQISTFPMGEGNSYANIVNSKGLLAQSGDWIYYSNNSDEGALYKIKTNGTENQRIGTDIRCNNINVIGDWLIYKCIKVRASDLFSHEIIKMKTDGSDKEVLASSWKISFVYVNNKKMYYSTGTNIATSLRIMDLETKESKVYDDENYSYMQAPFILNDDIYFLDSYNSENHCGTLQKKSFNGNDKVQIIDIPVRKFMIYDDWIYYTTFHFSLHRAKLDGTEDKEIISGKYFSAFSITDEGIFASDNKLLKISFDGSTHDSFSTNIVLDEFFFTVTDNHIYYLHNNGDGIYNKLYRIGKDGTDMQLLPFCVDW